MQANDPAKEQALLEGRDLTTWPTMKLERAHALLNDMFGRVAIWNASRAYLAPTRIAPDRLSVELLAPTGIRPPLDEWALIIGDAFHNIRSALDAMAWEFAHLEREPLKPRQVYFPVTADAQKWAAKAKELESIPDNLLERLRQLQPWFEPQADGVIHWLDVISEVNNDDKHRGSVTALPIAGGIKLQGSDVRLGERDGEGSFEIWHNGVDSTLEPDTVIARFRFGARIDDGATFEPAHMDMAPAIRVRDQLIPVGVIQNKLIPYVVGALQFLRVGSWPETTEILPDRFEPHTPTTGG